MKMLKMFLKKLKCVMKVISLKIEFVLNGLITLNIINLNVFIFYSAFHNTEDEFIIINSCYQILLLISGLNMI